MKKYIYLVLILLVTIVISFFGIKLYADRFLEKDSNIFLEKPYSQIKVTELKDFLTETSDFVIYINNLKSTDVFQSELSTYITEKDIMSNILFIDGRELSSKDIKYLKSIYKGELAFSTINFEVDNIIKIDDRVIVDYMELSDISTINNVDSFLTKNKALND